MIISIDPGTTESGFVVWDGKYVRRKGIVENDTLVQMLRPGSRGALIEQGLPKGNSLVIEQIRSYGMAVGKETFDTVFWSGRFAEAWNPRPWSQVPRLAVKMHLCHSARAKDTNVWQAIVDRFGAPGTVKKPNLHYGEEYGDKTTKLVKHMRAALALAITVWDGGRREDVD